MSFLNHSTREVNVKIVYWGPELSGKVTNMSYIYNKTNPDARARSHSYSTEPQELFFDLSPQSLGPIIRDYRARFHLYEAPNDFYNERRTQCLRGADGVIFIADSQLTRTEANINSLEMLIDGLQKTNHNITDIPLTLQYNKRDLSDLATLEELDDELRLYPWDRFDAVATKGIGVFESLKSICKQTITRFKEKNHE